MVLAGVVAREIIAGRNWRNLPMIAPLVVLAAASLLMHLEAAGLSVPAGLGWRLGLAAVLVLISVVAGRIVPSFTRNWLTQRGATTLPAAPGGIDRAALGMLHAGLFAWVAFPEFAPVGFVLLAGAGFNLWRLLRWRGSATIAEPLLVVLHFGYGWLVLGSALLGLSMLDPYIPRSAAIHALTAGAVGTMILAVMTRATRGHTGRELSADIITSLIFVLVSLAATTRVIAAIWVVWTMPLIIGSAIFWIVAFLLFVAAYGPMLLLPRRSS